MPELSLRKRIPPTLTFISSEWIAASCFGSKLHCCARGLLKTPLPALNLSFDLDLGLLAEQRCSKFLWSVRTCIGPRLHGDDILQVLKGQQFLTPDSIVTFRRRQLLIVESTDWDNTALIMNLGALASAMNGKAESGYARTLVLR